MSEQEYGGVSRSRPSSAPKRPTRYTTPNAARNAEIIRRRKAGEGPRAIARALALSPGAVSSVLRHAGLQSDNPRYSHCVPRPGCGAHPKISDDGVREIRARVAAGERQKSIAYDLGCSQGLVSAISTRRYRAHVA